MPTRRESLVAGNFYHVFNRGVERRRIFFGRENALFFLRRLREKTSGRATVIAYCLMPNHFHLLVRPADGEFAAVMQAFGTSYSKAINRRRGRVGPLFRGRFRAVRVDREEGLWHLSHYIHRNPVAARLVGRPADWEMSSYRDYVGLRNGTLPDPTAVLAAFESRSAYRKFVEAEDSPDDSQIGHLLLD